MKREHGKPLFRKIFLNYVLIAFGVLGVFLAFGFGAFREFHYESTRNALEARSRLVSPALAPLLEAKDFDGVQDLVRGLGRDSGTRFTVILPGGRVVGDSEGDPAAMDNHAGRPEVASALGHADGASVRHSHTLDQDHMYLAHPIERGGEIIGVVRASLPLNTIDGALRGFFVRLVLAAILLLGIAAVASWRLSLRISAPLERMKNLAESIARGDFSARVRFERGDPVEIERLGEAINKIAIQVSNDVTHLRALENHRREFVSNVSHELRTPLTSIQGFVETLLDGAYRKPEESQRFLGIIQRQASRLAAIVEDLLDLSRIEDQTERKEIALTEQALRPILDAAVEVCLPKAREKGIPIEVECPEGLRAAVNAPLLEQAVINLVDNAVKYSENTRPVRVVASEVPGRIEIRVIDQGAGIPQEHLGRLFERFYRVDKARSRGAGGTGLGLAIVKHIAIAHGGGARVESEPGKGSRFILEFPAGKPSDPSFLTET